MYSIKPEVTIDERNRNIQLDKHKLFSFTMRENVDWLLDSGRIFILETIERGNLFKTLLNWITLTKTNEPTKRIEVTNLTTRETYQIDSFTDKWFVKHGEVYLVEGESVVSYFDGVRTVHFEFDLPGNYHVIGVEEDLIILHNGYTAELFNIEGKRTGCFYWTLCTDAQFTKIRDSYYFIHHGFHLYEEKGLTGYSMRIYPEVIYEAGGVREHFELYCIERENNICIYGGHKSFLGLSIDDAPSNDSKCPFTLELEKNNIKPLFLFRTNEGELERVSITGDSYYFIIKLEDKYLVYCYTKPNKTKSARNLSKAHN